MASLIIANGALAMGSKVTMFFTFWGLNLLRKPDAPTPKKSLIDAAFGFMLPKGVGRANRLTTMNFLGAGGRLMRKVMRDKRVANSSPTCSLRWFRAAQHWSPARCRWT